MDCEGLSRHRGAPKKPRALGLGWKLKSLTLCLPMQRLPQLLICDDDAVFQLSVKQVVKGKYECRTAYNADEALVILRKHPVDILLLDIQMRSTSEGLNFIPKFLEIDPDLAISMVSGLTDYKTVRDAMVLGAADYIGKDLEPEALLLSLGKLLERRALIQRKDQQNFEAVTVQKQHSLVGQSPQIIQLRKTLERIRKSPANVVIFGETGTGKEVVARQLRGMLPDGSLAPFIAVDSSTIQSSTAESLLFGHEKGAFTGAEKTTKGIFEEAHGGLVYFDEIANMPLDIQAKLLRVLQEKEVARLGSSKVMQLDFRVVCATNKNLDEMVKTGQFKDDLLQRLSVLPIELAPLRERRDDIPLLVEHFMRKQPLAANGLSFTSEALEILMNYAWPGNIRELSNLIAYVVAMTEGNEVDVADLPPKIRDAVQSAARSALKSGAIMAGSAAGGNFYDQVGAFESALLAQAYTQHDANVSKMALALGMDRSHLYTKLKEYGIHGPKSGKSKT
jgi:DNA-binding NtrC family response regulator